MHRAEDTAAVGLVHQAAEHNSEGELLDVVGRYVRDGHRRGEHVACLAPAPTWDVLHSGLGDLASSVELVDSQGWRTPARALSALSTVLAGRPAGSPRTRVVATFQHAAMSPREAREWARLDAVLNVALADRDLTLLCLYDGRTLPPQVTRDVGRTHPSLVGSAGRWLSPHYVRPAVFVRECDAVPFTEPDDAAEVLPVEDHRALLLVREGVRLAARNLGVTADRAEDLALAANEIVSNALHHGDGAARVRLWVHDGELVCEVADDGPGIDQSFPGLIPPDPSHAASGGLGLWLARQLSDLMQVRSTDSGCTVRLHLRLEPGTRR